jgi:hypothetical protein
MKNALCAITGIPGIKVDKWVLLAGHPEAKPLPEGV